METAEYLLTNIILPLVIGGVGAYAYPRIESYFRNRSLSMRDRRLQDLFDQYISTKKLLDANLLIITSINVIALALRLFAILLILIGLATTIPELPIIFRIPLMIAIGYFGTGIFLFLDRISNRVENFEGFENYRVTIIAKIKKQGGNPEVLDNIDREFEEAELLTPVKKTRRPKSG